MSENVEKKIFIADKFLTSYICLTDVQSKHSFTLTGLIVTAVWFAGLWGYSCGIAIFDQLEVSL